eukprot:TRINITY_DN2611_c0_g1_i9.p2 TRINITY_DN2611_c0_g1~~TRINITY_DN2611_c0_g1_i9.p2  ORF type:complete len:228 (-),score=90.88 TRINITY_DN2611_c0_g1_i9:46-729(-)
MADQFRTIKKKAKALLVEIDEGLDDFNNNKELEKRTPVMQKLEKKLNEVDEQMKELRVEMAALKASNKEKTVVKKYNKIEKRYSDTRKNFLQQKENFETQKNRNEVLKKPSSKAEQLERDTRMKLEGNIGTLEKQDEQLTGITRMAQETEGTTNSIITNLRKQRNKITTATDDVRAANSNVKVGTQVIDSMTRREWWYKVMLHVVIVVLFLAPVSYTHLTLPTNREV